MARLYAFASLGAACAIAAMAANTESAAGGPKAKDVARVTVLRGSVSHPRADDGEAVKDQSFLVTEAEAIELSSLAVRGVVSIAAL